MAAVRVVVVHVAPRVEAAAVVAVLAVIVVVHIAVVDEPPRFWRDARAFCSWDQKAGSADPPDAATEMLFDAT